MMKLKRNNPLKVSFSILYHQIKIYGLNHEFSPYSLKKNKI